MARNSRRFTLLTLFVFGFLAPGAFALPTASSSGNSSAQQGSSSASNSTQSSTLPDSPGAQRSQSAQQAEQEELPPQTKRILGIIPNFRAISTREKLPPQTVKDKFLMASQDSFDYSSLFIPAMLAAYGMGTNSIPEFHQGAAGYGRYFWHSFVDQTSENYMVEFVVPVITHEDTRLYTLGYGGFWKRTGYALSRVVVTRSDSGQHVFNYGEVVGAGAAAGLSNLYYPAAQRGLGNTGKQWGIDVGIDAGTFVFKEFWPDINHRLFHGDKPIQPQ